MSQSAATEDLAALYAEGVAVLLRDLVDLVKRGEAKASEKATLAALLGKAGVLARTGSAGQEGDDQKAWRAHLDSMPPEKLQELLDRMGKKAAGPRAPRGRVEARTDAGSVGNAA